MKKLEKIGLIMDGLLFVLINLGLCIMWYLAAKEYPQYSLLNAVAILFYWKYRPVINLREEDAEEIINAINKKNNAKRGVKEEVGRDDSADKAK